ncbi:hypothetical protein HN51_012514, partial [Arachis hypogaea]
MLNGEKIHFPIVSSGDNLKLNGEKIHFPIVSSGDNLKCTCNRGTESIRGRAEGCAVLLRRVGVQHQRVHSPLGRTSIWSSPPRPLALAQPQVLSYFSHALLLFDHLSPSNHFNSLYHLATSDQVVQIHKGYSSLLSFTVTDINTTVTKLMALGAELDDPIKYEIHGKVAAMRCLDGHMLGLYEP